MYLVGHTVNDPWIETKWCDSCSSVFLLVSTFGFSTVNSVFVRTSIRLRDRRMLEKIFQVRKILPSLWIVQFSSMY